MKAGKLLLLSVFTIVIGSDAFAQSPYIHTVQDSVKINRIAGGDTAGIDQISAAYRFGFVADSCLSSYLLTELRHNGAPVELDDWYPGRMLDTLTADDLTNRSYSRPIVVHAGDTLSFYREFTWGDHMSGSGLKMEVGNFQSEDSAAILVELRYASDTTLALLLDSFAFDRQAIADTPSFYGILPILKKVVWYVDSTYDGDTVIFAPRISIAGQGDHYPLRRDEVTCWKRPGRMASERSITPDF